MDPAEPLYFLHSLDSVAEDDPERGLGPWVNSNSLNQLCTNRSSVSFFGMAPGWLVGWNWVEWRTRCVSCKLLKVSDDSNNKLVSLTFLIVSDIRRAVIFPFGAAKNLCSVSVML